MDEQKMLADQVNRWQAEGRWVDRGRWSRAKNGTLEYLPTKREIAAKSANDSEGLDRPPSRIGSRALARWRCM